MSNEVSQEKQIELTIADIINVRNLIDVVTTRGAFKANELTSVGQLFDKINAFVVAATKKPEEASQENNASNTEEK
jgi:hypothetical protein